MADMREIGDHAWNLLDRYGADVMLGRPVPAPPEPRGVVTPDDAAMALVTAFLVVDRAANQQRGRLDGMECRTIVAMLAVALENAIGLPPAVIGGTDHVTLDLQTIVDNLRLSRTAQLEENP